MKTSAKNKTSYFRIATILFFTLVTLGCWGPFTPGMEQLKGNLTIHQTETFENLEPTGAARTLYPDLGDLGSQVVNYEFFFSPAGGNPQSAFSVVKPKSEVSSAWPAFTVNLTDLPYGSWNLEMRALNAGGSILLSGVTAGAITISGTAAVVDLNLKPIQSAVGLGDVKLRVAFPSGMGLQIQPAILQVQMIGRPGGIGAATFATVQTASWTILQDPDVNPATEDFQYTFAGLEAGDYRLTLKLAGWATGPYFIETLHIYDNLRTAADWTFNSFMFGDIPTSPAAPSLGIPMWEKFPDDGTLKNRIVINWKDLSTNEIGFRIYRSEDNGISWNFLVQTGPNSTSYTDNNAGVGLTLGTPYKYRVHALSFAGESSFYEVADNIIISPVGQLEAKILGVNYDVLMAPSIAVDTLYGRTPIYDTLGGGTSIPVALKNSGATVLNISALALSNASLYFSQEHFDLLKNPLTVVAGFSLNPGESRVIQVKIQPAATSGSFSETLTFNDGSARTFTFTGNLRGRTLYVKQPTDGGGDGNAGDTVGAALGSLSRALEISRDADTIKIKASPNIFYMNSIVKTRVVIEGDYLSDFIGQDLTDDTRLRGNPMTGVPTLAFVDLPYLAGANTLASRLTVEGESSSDATMKILNAKVNLDNVTILMPDTMGSSVGLLVDSPNYSNFFMNLTIKAPLGMNPSSLTYMKLLGSNTEIANSRFEANSSGSASTGNFWGIIAQPTLGGAKGYLQIHDSVIQVGTSNFSSAGYGLYIDGLTGAGGMKNLIQNNTFINVGSPITLSNDTAVYLGYTGADGSPGFPEYRVLTEGNKFYMKVTYSGGKSTGVKIASQEVGAAVVGNLYQLTDHSSGQFRGVVDQGWQTRIYNNTFLTKSNTEPSPPSATWIETLPGAYPKVANNYLSGRYATSGSSTTGIDRSASGPLQTLENNVFSEVSTPAPTYLTAAALNTLGNVADKASQNRVTSGGAMIWPNTFVDANHPGLPFGIISSSNPLMMWGGKNLEADLLNFLPANDWAGARTFPNFKTFQKDIRRNSVGLQPGIPSGGGTWSVGADDFNVFVNPPIRPVWVQVPVMATKETFNHNVEFDNLDLNFVSAGYIVGAGDVDYGNATGTLTSTVSNPANGSARLVKYNSAHQAQWARELTVTGDSASDFAAISLDPSDNIYTAGGVWGTVNYTLSPSAVNITGSFGAGPSVLLAKYDSTGLAQWVKGSTSGWSALYQGVKALATDVVAVGRAGGNTTHDFSGGISIAPGNSNVPSSTNMIILVKYLSDGTPQWVRHTTNTVGTKASEGISIDRNAAGDSFIGGYINGNQNFTFAGMTTNGSSTVDNFYVAKVLNDGSPGWAKSTVTGSDRSVANRVILSADGQSLYVLGYISGPGVYDFGNAGQTVSNPGAGAGLLTPVLVKYNANDGSVLWARVVQSLDTSDANGLGLDSSGNIILGLNLVGNTNPYDFGNGVQLKSALTGKSAAIIKYAPNGEAISATTLSASIGTTAEVKRIAIKGDAYLLAGNLLNADNYNFGLDPGSTPVSVSGVFASGMNAFIARFENLLPNP